MPIKRKEITLDQANVFDVSREIYRLLDGLFGTEKLLAVKWAMEAQGYPLKLKDE